MLSELDMKDKAVQRGRVDHVALLSQRLVDGR